VTIKPHTPSALLAGACCALALAAPGCGSDEEGKGIPPAAAQQLDRQLDSVQRRFEMGGGACRDIVEGDDTDVDRVEQFIDGLPTDVDPDVRDALERSFRRLFDLVQEECQPPETDTETETTPPETVPPETTPTETTPTETTPTETETETQPPADQDGNQGSGGGGGGGQGGGRGQGGGQGGEQAPEGDG
jgi:hypothetical protein